MWWQWWEQTQLSQMNAPSKQWTPILSPTKPSSKWKRNQCFTPIANQPTADCQECLGTVVSDAFTGPSDFQGAMYIKAMQGITTVKGIACYNSALWCWSEFMIWRKKTGVPSVTTIACLTSLQYFTKRQIDQCGVNVGYLNGLIWRGPFYATFGSRIRALSSI